MDLSVREMVQAEAEKQIQLKRERGEHARLQAEEKAGIIHAQKVLQVEVRKISKLYCLI